MKPMPPYRPFRMIAHGSVSLAVALVVWLPLALLNSGFTLGPAEYIQFNSLDQARQSAFSGYGIVWPGSRVEVRETNTGYVIERRWLWWTEVGLPMDEELATNTAAYDWGPGETIQQAVLTAVALAAGGILFAALRVNARNQRRHEISELSAQEAD